MSWAWSGLAPRMGVVAVEETLEEELLDRLVRLRLDR